MRGEALVDMIHHKGFLHPFLNNFQVSNVFIFLIPFSVTRGAEITESNFSRLFCIDTIKIVEHELCLVQTPKGTQFVLAHIEGAYGPVHHMSCVEDASGKFFAICYFSK